MKIQRTGKCGLILSKNKSSIGISHIPLDEGIFKIVVRFLFVDNFFLRLLRLMCSRSRCRLLVFRIAEIGLTHRFPERRACDEIAQVARRVISRYGPRRVRSRGSRAGTDAERALSASRPARHQRYALTGLPDNRP